MSASPSRDTISSEDLDALSSLGPGLAAAASSLAWVALLNARLLAGNSEEPFEVEGREEVLALRLPSIAYVTEHFMSRLGERSELLPVSRVKRPARRSLERLTAHTEDWAGRSLSGPVPRRALAVTREEDANLYENRMVTELLHPILSTALLTRIRTLRRLVSDLGDLSAAQHVGTFRRTERLYAFWGDDAVRASESHHHAEATLRTLERLAAWVQSLRGGTLPRLLSGRTTGQRSLRRTNVIENDRHYRAAGEVWIAYERPADPPESPDQRRSRLIDRHRAFDDYVLGLVVRALDALGYTSESGTVPAAGQEVGLQGTWGTVTLGRGVDGVLTIGSAGSTTRFVPLLDLIGPDDDHAAITRRWKDLGEVVTSATVVVFLAAANQVRAIPDAATARAMSSARDDALSTRPLLSGVPVSPLETTSLERIARGVRLAVYVPPLMNYPPVLTLGGEPMPVRLVDHIESAGLADSKLSPLFTRDQNHLMLRRPLEEAERAKLNHVIHGLQVAVRGSDWPRDYGAQIGQLKSAFEQAERVLRPLLNCPVCFAASEARRMQRDGDIFSAECGSCGTRWGHLRCGNCQARIPILETVPELPNREIDGPGWVERILGQDALSSPCWARPVSSRYICPECRTCSLAAEKEGAACTRCH